MPDSDFRELFDAVAAVGRSESGWTRPPWSAPLREAEEVVIAAAARSGLVSSHDAAGNLWLTDPAAETGLVAAGSHLDTVPDGGAFDGALGVVSAVVAVARLRAAGVAGSERLAVVSFADEEGWRFGTPIFGSRVLTGVYGAGGARPRGCRRRAPRRRGAARSVRRARRLPAAGGVHRGARRAGPRARPGGCRRSASPPRSPRGRGSRSSARARPTTPAPRPWPSATTRWWPPPAWCSRPMRPPAPSRARSRPWASSRSSRAARTSSRAASPARSTCARPIPRDATRWWRRSRRRAPA